MNTELLGAGPLLAARDIRKSYGRGAARFDALTGVSLAVHAGESIAIVGKSGSGKSTLMHLLALLDQPDDGTLLVSDADSTQLSVRQLNRLRNEDFGFVFQQFFLTPNATVLENVVLPLKIAGIGAKQRRARGMAVLEQLKMADKAGNKAVTLSGGQKQRVVIARHRRPGRRPPVLAQPGPRNHPGDRHPRSRPGGAMRPAAFHPRRTRSALPRHPRSCSMKPLDLARAAIGNTFRSKTRTTLTVIAIMIGAFTLTITSAIGTGVSNYLVAAP